MSNGLFRKNASDNLSSPEQLNKSVNLLRFPTWILWACLILGFITVCIWACFGSITNKVSVSGVIFPAEDVERIVAASDGIVQDIVISEGEYINRGDIVAVLSNDAALQPLLTETDDNSLKLMREEYIRKYVVKSEFSGYVQKISPIGTKIEKGDVLSVINVSDIDSGYNEVVAYMPLDAANTLALGMETQISPKFAPREEYGYMDGVITSISSIPATEESIIKHMGTMDYVNSIMPDITCVEVRIKISYDPNSKNLYRWSNSNGELLNVDVGTQCDLQIITNRQKPIELMLR